MTAVEWFAKQVLRSRQLGFISNEKFNELLDQAKEIEKEQMETTWNNAIDAQLKDKWDSYDDFHKTTFKSE